MSSIDRFLPFCDFCLRESRKKELYIDKNEICPKCYSLSVPITVYRIENAIKKEFIPCIHHKFKYLVCCEENVQYFFITEDLYRQFVYLKKGRLYSSSRLRNKAKYKEFFRLLERYGFIIKQRSGISDFDDSFIVKRQNLPKDVNLTGAITSNIFLGYKDGKKIIIKFLEDNGTGREIMSNTINCLNILGSQTFLPTLLSYDRDSLFYIVEYIEGVNLLEYIKNRNIEERTALAYSLVKMVSKLNSVGVVHQDLNISQFIVTNDKRLVMIDLDSLCFSDAKSKNGTNYFTFEYIEPERMCLNPFTLVHTPYIVDLKVQAYQLGVIIFTIFFNVPPCYDMTWKMLRRQKKKFDISFFLLSNMNSVPFSFIKILNKSLSRVVRERYSSPYEMLKDLIIGEMVSDERLNVTDVDKKDLL